MSAQTKKEEALAQCVCGHVRAHHHPEIVYDTWHCRFKGCGCPFFVRATTDTGERSVEQKPPMIAPWIGND